MLQSFRYFNVCCTNVTLEIFNQSKSAGVFKNDGLEVTQQRLLDQSGCLLLSVKPERLHAKY